MKLKHQSLEMFTKRLFESPSGTDVVEGGHRFAHNVFGIGVLTQNFAAFLHFCMLASSLGTLAFVTVATRPSMQPMHSK